MFESGVNFQGKYLYFLGTTPLDGLNLEGRKLNKINHQRNKIDMYVAGRVSKDGINQEDVDSDESDTTTSGRRLWSGSKSKPWQPWHYYWVSGTVPDYKQHSCCGCISGCGPVAWAQSFGWADRKAQSSSSWSKNIFLSNGGSGSAAIAPSGWPSTSAGQKPIKSFIEDIRDKVDTFCFFGSGATTLWDMDDVNGWFKARNGGNGGVSTKYNIFGWKEDRLMKCARYEIKNLKQPVVIGTGWLKHYPSAVGYAYRKSRGSQFTYGTRYGYRGDYR